MKNFVIVGGGTAGWLTALYTKMFFPEDKVTVVESSEIGILGAGEATTPITVGLLDFLQIPTESLIKNTQTTFKNGTKFTNWSKDKDFYHHAFIMNEGDFHPFRMNIGLHTRVWNSVSLYEIISMYKGKKRKEYDFHSLVSEKNKVFLLKNFSVESQGTINDFNIAANYAINFDARELAKFLADIGFQRGIYKVDDIVKTFQTDEKGNITKIILENQEIDCDFVFDCSGFHRIIIGKFYNSEWKSYKKHLPMKKAIPFFMDIDQDNMPPYVESTAMNYGWSWKIPLQHRYGCGYVYDSDFISDDEAKKELDNFIGYEVESPRTIDFNPGGYKKTWINNCLALGLSSGFIEPLEATSLMQMSKTIERFFSNRQNIFSTDQKYKDIFNREVENEMQQILDFIYMHYMTNKQDNDFWINFTKNNIIPETLEEKIFLLNNSTLDLAKNLNVFSSWSYYVVAHGIGLLDLNNIKDIYEKNNFNMPEILEFYDALVSAQEENIKQFVDHSFAIKYLRG